MYQCDNYGVVYTPKNLSAFVADLLIDVGFNGIGDSNSILDPACGEGILLETIANKLEKKNGAKLHCYGVDVDSSVISANETNFCPDQFTFIQQNFIIPSNKISAYNYWLHRLKKVSCVIANPPWSSEKVFSRDDLNNAGYQLDIGQYDSYVLFIELCLKIVNSDALLAFIVPDSLFSGENKSLRKFLLENTEILILARLGEKLFQNINRAASVIVVKKHVPSQDSQTYCYRLDTNDRKLFLENRLNLFENYLEKKHAVFQKRFLDNPNYVFDIDTREEEEALINKIERDCIDWNKLFHFGRGVEISKSGAVVTCKHCGMAQGYTKKHSESGEKTCQFCKNRIIISDDVTSTVISDSVKPGFTPMYVGENLHRYALDGKKYIKPNIKGINYKEKSQYYPPKILIRKTGLGIYACIDYLGTYTSQTVYSITPLDDSISVPLEYYLGVLNSRLIYYYYLKKYGENEWKSHPYLTKDIIFSLPIKAVSHDCMDIALQIANNVKDLQNKYTRAVDLQTEKLVMELYSITGNELSIISREMNSLPDLSAINQMKFEDGSL